MQQLNKTTIQNVIDSFNKLYVLGRYKYLIQTKDGQYYELEKGKGKFIPLSNSLLQNHLQGNATYGVFAGKLIGSKFICFDVDSSNIVTSKHVAFKLVYLLGEVFNIPSQYVAVSFSGSKGYHVELFFDQPIPMDTLRGFYKDVMTELGDTGEVKVELRPTEGQGVKLPLGIHQKAGNRCWYVDTHSLNPIEDFNHVLNLKQMDAEDFLSLLEDADIQAPLELEPEQAQEVIDIVSTTNLDAGVKTSEEAEQDCHELLTLNRLKYPNTRHNVTFMLARFLYSYGWDEEAAVERILELLHNTPRSYFSKDSSPELWEKETKRLVELTFKNGYSLGNGNREVRVYKSELLEILKAKTLNQKVMLFSMLVHSKRYARKDGVFYMAYSTMESMTGLTRKTLISNVNKLEKAGLLEVVERDALNEAQTKEFKKVVKKPNKYKVAVATTEEQDEPFIVIPPKTQVELMEAVVKLFDRKEVKEIVPVNQYKQHFSKAFSKLAG